MVNSNMNLNSEATVHADIHMLPFILCIIYIIYGISYLLSNQNVSHSSLVVSKHGLYVGSLGSIPTAVTTRTAGGDAEHLSLNH